MTITDAYLIPRIDESLSQLSDAKFFTTLDWGSAYWQVRLRNKNREKTGFACELGFYQWRRMPYAFCKATATFQRLIAQALTRVTKKYGNLVMCYVDDVVIARPKLEDHFDRLDEVFGCSKRAGLKCKPSKCEILMDWSKYLGRMVDRLGVRPDPEAVKALLKWKAPRTDTQLLSFQGVCQLLAWVHKRIRGQGVPHAETDSQQGKEVRMERRSSSCLREHKAGSVRSVSARHANNRWACLFLSQMHH